MDHYGITYCKSRLLTQMATDIAFQHYDKNNLMFQLFSKRYDSLAPTKRKSVSAIQIQTFICRRRLTATSFITIRPEHYEHMHLCSSRDEKIYRYCTQCLLQIFNYASSQFKNFFKWHGQMFRLDGSFVDPELHINVRLNVIYSFQAVLLKKKYQLYTSFLF